MPNTLAHLGIQAFAMRRLIPNADLKWVYLGCILPDIPWILRRVVERFAPEVPIYDLRLYAIVQSSLFMSLVLACGLATFSRQSRRVFGILVLGSVMHLLLDAIQTKWGSGVHLFAPFSWETLNFGVFWPEDLPSDLLSVFGLVFFVYAWRRIPCSGADLVLPRGRSLVLCGTFLLIYLLGPLTLLSQPEALDNHSVKTLRYASERAGRPVELDRNRYEQHPDGDVLVTFAGERLRVEGMTLPHSGTVSVRGRFLDPNTLEILDLHAHRSLGRDLASYVGLALILLLWARVLMVERNA